jgi:hypothetical protein
VTTRCLTTIGFALALAGWPIAAYRPRNPIGLAMLLPGCGSGVGEAVTSDG